jgi:hypothetical protein
MRPAPARRALLCGLLALAAGAVARAQTLAGAQQPPGAQTPRGAQTPAPSADGRRALSPPRAETAPHLDGLLDEAVWQTAAVATGFLQQRPATGQPASQATDVRVLYTADALYLGFVCAQSDPRRIVHQVLGRDTALWDDDYLAIALDTFDDLQNGYFFQVNPNGVRYDAQFRNEGRLLNTDWDGLWAAAVRITDTGWQGEIELPWRTLRFPVREHITMGINFERQLRAVNEQSQWSPIDRQFNLFRVADAGHLQGLSGISPGSNIVARPYALGRLERGSALDPAAFDRERWKGHGEVGYDLKLGLTSSAELDVTVNTDFAQVEVDDQVVNLTRFPLFYPEKREFFLEKRDFFQFGSPANLALFSRRIGLEAVAGEGGLSALTIPIEYGTRLTGKFGRTDVGLLDIQTDASGDVPRHRFDVARISQDFGTRSRIGAIAVSRQGEDGGDFNRVFGLDTDFRPAEQLDLSGYAAFSHEPQDGPDHGTWGTRWRWSHPLFNMTTLYEVYGRDYHPRAGFLPRNDITTAALELGWTPEPNAGWLRRLENFVYAEHVARRDGVKESTNLQAQTTLFGSGDEELAVYYTRNFERLFEPFEVGGDVVFPAGAFTFDQLGAELTSDRSKALSAHAELVLGDEYDGKLTSAAGELTARWAPHLAVSAEVQSDRIRRDDSALGRELRFDADVLRLRVGVDATNELSFDLFTQLNSDEDLVLSQLRAHYIFGDESDVYLVLTDVRNDATGNYALRRGEATLKLSYALRF